jgi:hypothetical protein
MKPLTWDGIRALQLDFLLYISAARGFTADHSDIDTFTESALAWWKIMVILPGLGVKQLRLFLQWPRTPRLSNGSFLFSRACSETARKLPRRPRSVFHHASLQETQIAIVMRDYSGFWCSDVLIVSFSVLCRNSDWNLKRSQNDFGMTIRRFSALENQANWTWTSRRNFS